MAHPPLRISAHALRRMELRGITREEVRAVLDEDHGVLQERTGRWAHEAEIGGRWITVIRRANGTIHSVAPGRGKGRAASTLATMSSTVPTATYYPEADALAIDLEGSGPRRSARTEHLDERRFVDYDGTGRAISIELLDVSGGVVFDGLPEAGLVRGVVARLAADQGWAGRA